MISLENIPTEDVVFFSVIVFGGLYTIFFYIMVGFFIKKKKDNFAEKLFGDKTHNLSLERCVIAGEPSEFGGMINSHFP